MGPGRGGPDLRKVVAFSQIRLATPIAAASVHAAPSDHAHYNDGGALVVVLCSASKDANALANGRVRKSAGWPLFSRQWTLSMQSSLGSHQLRVPLMAFISVAVETIHTRSLVTTAAHISMLHVLTGVRSRRAYRLSSFLFNSSHEPAQTLRNAALHRTRAVAAARDDGRRALAMELVARAYTLVHRGGHMLTDGRLGAHVVLHAGHDLRRPACARWSQHQPRTCGHLNHREEAWGRV